MNNTDLRRVLFVSHEATRTGAPFLLLHFLEWLKEHTDLPFSILLRKGGALEPEFAAIAPTVVLGRETSYGSGILERLASIFGFGGFVEEHALARIKKQYARENIGLIYSNTATNGEILAWLRDLGTPVISHIHELEFLMQQEMDPVELDQMFANTDYYIAGAEAAKNNLVQNHGIAPELVKTIHEFIPTPQHNDTDVMNIRQSIREQLRIPDNAPIIGAAGTSDWRKGVDLFVQLARVTYKQDPGLGVHFVWVGGESKGIHINRLRHDLSKLGLSKVVHFVGAQTNFRDYLASFDIFSLVSREDCLPLVVLEAALLKKPILCFDKAGGAGEFVKNDAGFVVPYLDLELMGERAITLLRDPDLRRTLGECAANKAKQQHDVAVIAPRTLQIILRFISGQEDGSTLHCAK